jgi:hypothetical protein
VALWLSARSAFRLAQVVAGRLTFPYDVEWMEGGVVDHVLRVLDGKPIYVEPHFDFVPFIYNPLFYWLGAATTLVMGPGPPALRLVSVLGIVVASAATVALVRRVTGSLAGGVLAAGCFLATYELSGGWMDVARVDSTFVALQLVAVLVSTGRGSFWAVSSAFFLCAAFLAKQYSLVVALPIAAYLLLAHGRRRAAVFAVAALVFVGISLAWLNLATDGWHWFWTARVPAVHPRYDLGPHTFVLEHLGSPLPVMTSVAVAGTYAMTSRALAPSSRAPGERRERLADAALVVGFGVVLGVEGWASYIHAGRYLNCLLPAHLAVCLLAACTVDGRTVIPRGVSTFAVGVLSVQLWLLDYDAGRWIPAPGALGEAKRLERDLRRGDTLYGFRGFFGSPGANPAHAHQMAASDLLAAGQAFPELAQRLVAEAEAHFAARPYGRVVLDNWDYVFLPALTRHYRKVKEIPVGRGPYWTPTAAPMKPRIFFEPKAR